MSPTTSPPPLPSRRQRIGGGRYELIEVAGRGGMATVWRAWLHGPGRFRRTMAVKHMFPHLAEKPFYREMFHEEARIGSVLHDPNVPQVFEFFIDGDDCYLAMEFIDGIDLGTYLRYVCDRRGEKTRWDMIAAIGIGMLRGLAAAHERRADNGRWEPIIHRDVSPHNVLISEKGIAKLIDFGLAFARDRESEDTDPGVAKGKLAYLSPEVTRGDKARPASDQFAAGSVLWEALVGRQLFGDTDQYEAYRRVANAEVPPLRNERRDVPKDLERLVHRALALDPDKRFPSTREMAKALGDVLKRSVAKEDLYASLARAVSDARQDLGIGRRTQGPEGEPLQGTESGLVKLLVNEGKKVGLGRFLPSFFKR